MDPNNPPSTEMDNLFGDDCTMDLETFADPNQLFPSPGPEHATNDPTPTQASAVPANSNEPEQRLIPAGLLVLPQPQASQAPEDFSSQPQPTQLALPQGQFNQAAEAQPAVCDDNIDPSLYGNNFNMGVSQDPVPSTDPYQLPQPAQESGLSFPSGPFDQFHSGQMGTPGSFGFVDPSYQQPFLNQPSTYQTNRSLYPDPSQGYYPSPYGPSASAPQQLPQYTQTLVAQNPIPFPAPAPTTPAVAAPAASALPVAEPQGQETGRPKRRRLSSPRVVSHDRAAKRRRQSNTNPERSYQSVQRPQSWGPLENGRHLFEYTHTGELLPSVRYSARQIRHYIDNCPRPLRMWIQHYPAQKADRLPPGGIVCRWERCPLKNAKINSGWIQVAFDEYPDETSDSTRDPFKVAGHMHLWCYERCFDPIHDYSRGTLRPDARSFRLEQKNPMALTRDQDKNIVHAAVRPWFTEAINNASGSPPRDTPRAYEDSLSAKLVDHHIISQKGCKQMIRDKRNSNRTNVQRKTIDVHRGDLAVYVQRAPTQRSPLDTLPLESDNQFQRDPQAHADFTGNNAGLNQPLIGSREDNNDFVADTIVVDTTGLGLATSPPRFPNNNGGDMTAPPPTTLPVDFTNGPGIGANDAAYQNYLNSLGQGNVYGDNGIPLEQPQYMLPQAPQGTMVPLDNGISAFNNPATVLASNTGYQVNDGTQAVAPQSFAPLSTPLNTPVNWTTGNEANNTGYDNSQSMAALGPAPSDAGSDDFVRMLANVDDFDFDEFNLDPTLSGGQAGPETTQANDAASHAQGGTNNGTQGRKRSLSDDGDSSNVQENGPKRQRISPRSGPATRSSARLANRGGS